MQQVKVNAVGLEPFEAALAGVDDPLLRGVVRQHLADDEQPVASALSGLGNNFLAGPHLRRPPPRRVGPPPAVMASLGGSRHCVGATPRRASICAASAVWTH